jgi:hypothetical protein
MPNVKTFKFRCKLVFPYIEGENNVGMIPGMAAMANDEGLTSLVYTL